MMVNQSVLQMTAMQSVLASESHLNPKAGRGKRSIYADLLLTALIDAFSILVIFLLMQFSSSSDILYINKSMELPQAHRGTILEQNDILRIEDGKYFLGSLELAADGLVAALLDVREKFQKANPNVEFPGVLTIQADRRAKYESLNSIVLAASHAGYSDIRFAVVMK